MANKNNKGFSLIEIVIAMAVLTLLLTPIIKQFAQTMKVSRMAKEQQYVNEEAVYTLEEAQVTSEKELVKKYSDIAAADPDMIFATSTDVRYCKLVDASGTEISLDDDKGNPVASNLVEYTVNEYELKYVEVGPENSLYNKITTVDNLATQVRGYKVSGTTDRGVKIKYGLTQDQIPAGYTLTNEGYALKYDVSGNVEAVVVEETPYVGNPNNTNLGNMQNLDYETVAMINGTASNFDDTAERAMYSDAMDELKKVNYEAWETHIKHAEGDGPLFSANTSFDREKLTKIYVKEDTELTGEKYFLVKVDVYYNYSFKLAEMTGNPVSGSVSYNIFAQKFYTDKCPDIYFEYQPFITELTESGATKSVEYADNDYILLDSYVDDVKLYIYKPFLDAENVAAGKTVDDYVQEDSYFYDSLKYDVTNNVNVNTNVKIHIAKANTHTKDMNIYTNLDVTYDAANPNASQFYVGADKFTSFSSVNSDDATHSADPFVDFDRTHIMSIQQDTRYNDRLRTVTVTMLPVSVSSTVDASGVTQITETVRQDANTVTLTGAKGEK